MKKDVKDRWIKDLRSGKYRQGQGRLVSNEVYADPSFCCLGVLAEGQDVPRRDGVFEFSGPAQVGIGLLPIEFCGKIGLRMDHRETLVMMNDRYAMSFGEIADWIEENIPDE